MSPKSRKITISLIAVIFLSSALAGPVYAIPTVDPVNAGANTATAAGVWAQFVKYVLKEFILDLAARLTARLQLTSGLNRIAQQVIQSGRTGRTPAFVQNWRNLITDAEYRGEDVFRSILSNTENCPNIKKDMLSMFGVKTSTPITQNIRVGNLDSFQVRGKCTMPRGWTVQNYDRDFAGNGGWEALARLADPQNNFYGSTIMAMGEIEVQRNLDRNTDLSEARAGGGYTGVRRSSRTGNSCDSAPTSPNYACVNCVNSGQFWRPSDNTCNTTMSINDITDPFACPAVSVPSAARCTFLGNVTTPANILGAGAAQFIDKNLAWLTTSDEISEILGSFIVAMTNKLADYTADTIAGGTKPDKVAEPEKTNYEACVRQCNNTSTGSQRYVCIDACYKGAGVDSPSEYDQFGRTTTLTPTPTPTPAPTRTPIPLPAGATRVTANLQTINGQYLGAEGGGGTTVIATATSAGAWETFVLYDLNGGTLNSGDQVGITTSGYYAFRAEGGGGSLLYADANSIGVWETFVITSTTGGAVATGNQVSFQTWNGANFIRAESGGGSTVDGAGASIGSWETFTITIP